MKTHYFKNILTILISLLGLQDTKICFVHSMDYTNCNKLWGVTQDANGRMLYKVGMYMCVEDPYNIYKNAYSSQIAPPLMLQNPQPNNITVNNSNITMQNITNISPNLINETKNVSIINETFFKVDNKTLNTSTSPQTTQLLLQLLVKLPLHLLYQLQLLLFLLRHKNNNYNSTNNNNISYNN